MQKRTITVLIPTFNEEKNVAPLYQELVNIFESKLSSYIYEILFIDNKSTDETRNQIKELCEKDPQVKAIFNARNYGQFNSPYYGLTQASGDCAVLLCADFQDPPEIVPSFVEQWEKGYKIVCGIKNKSLTNPIVHFIRGCYYRFIQRASSTEMIEHFTGFGLYDRSFIEYLNMFSDPTPFLRGIVAESGFSRIDIEYTQQKRRAGKTSNNLFTLYDAAMLSFTNYTKVGLRLPTIIGFFLSVISLLVALGYLVAKLLFWDSFPAGTAPIVIGVFFLGSVQLFFVGVLGEYILAMNERLKGRPLVIEEERINLVE